ncbi:MAG: ABC transporter ATP-binding protein [Pseudomonadota bacterium]
MLEVRDLSKSFGGVHAIDGVSLNVKLGEIHAVIGPNGAGKTTLVSQIAGEVLPDRGAIHLGGADITRLPPHARAQRGLARSYQITSVFRDMSVIDNVALAVQAHDGHSFRFWRPARSEHGLRNQAMEILDTVGLKPLAGQPVGALAHGQQRALEIAMALASEPTVLLLDEPLAGMGVEESREMVDHLRSLRPDRAVLLVEHDMDAVFQLADRISVLVYGKLIATGRPEDIRADPHVQAAYLGEEDA